MLGKKTKQNSSPEPSSWPLECLGGSSLDAEAQGGIWEKGLFPSPKPSPAQSSSSSPGSLPQLPHPHTLAWPLHLQPMQSPELYFKSAKRKPEHNYITPRPSVAPHFFRANYPIPADCASATTSLQPPVLTIAPHAPYQITVNSLGFPHCVVSSKSNPLLSTLLPLPGAPFLPIPSPNLATAAFSFKTQLEDHLFQEAFPDSCRISLSLLCSPRSSMLSSIAHCSTHITATPRTDSDDLRARNHN